MSDLNIVLVGAGSHSFGPATLNDIFLSDKLCERGVHIILMDISADHLDEMEHYAKFAAGKLNRTVRISKTTSLEKALEGADFVVTAFEVRRNLLWAEDYRIARKYGFNHIYGENGGPGSLFHSLRNIGPIVHIARQMEKICPDAWMLNYSNPMTKVCEAVNRLTSTKIIGLCHGVWNGMRQIGYMLDRPVDSMELAACGINHFTIFQTIRDKQTGEDLYPKLREADLAGNILADWHEIALSRIILRRYGVFPSPGANHIGEYIGWSEEFYCGEIQYFYDAGEGEPWRTGKNLPEFIYFVKDEQTKIPVASPPAEPEDLTKRELRRSTELAIPIMEAFTTGEAANLDAVNVTNHGLIPNLPEDLVVEVPATADANGLHPCKMEPLPEGIAALMRTQASINQLLIEAFAQQSKAKLRQAVLLEPTVNSYQQAMRFIDEMLDLQRDYLPPIR